MAKFFLLIAFIILFACGKSSIYNEDFVCAYAELRIAERQYGFTDEGKAARLQILQKHKLSLDDFEKTIEEIKKEPDEWSKFQDKLMAILDSIINNAKTEEEN